MAAAGWSRTPGSSRPPSPSSKPCPRRSMATPKASPTASPDTHDETTPQNTEISVMSGEDLPNPPKVIKERRRTGNVAAREMWAGTAGMRWHGGVGGGAAARRMWGGEGGGGDGAG